MFEGSSPARCFTRSQPPTPSPWKSRPPSRSPTTTNMPISERERLLSPSVAASPSGSANRGGDLFHVIHKVPAGDSPYVKAKQVQLVDKDPAKSIAMFWGAINSGDRVESALKDMALVMKQLNRSDEAIEAIKSFRHLCPSESQESLDNILVELYKRSGRVDEEIGMLHHKLKQIEDGLTFVGRSTKQARSQGKKIQITAEQEISRILGNLAWAYLQKGDYKIAEEHYRKALSFEVDRNKQCNLAICLMQMNKVTEAKFLLQAVSAATKNRKMDESFVKSFERASQMLIEMDSPSARCTPPECSPQSRPIVEPKKGTNTGRNSDPVKSWTGNRSSTYEVEAVPHARRRLYKSPDSPRIDLRVPHTNPKRSAWGFNNNGYQGDNRGYFHSHSATLSIGSLSLHKPPESGLSSPANGNWRASILEDSANESNWRSKISDPCHALSDGAKDFATGVDADQRRQGSGMASAGSNLHESAPANGKPLEKKKSWADIAEEEENEEQQDLFTAGYADFIGKDSGKMFGDENANSNIICQHPTARRSLCFDSVPTPEPASYKAVPNLESHRTVTRQGDSFSGENQLLARRNRLQVFQDITSSPRNHSMRP